MTSDDALSQKCKPCCSSVVACLLQLLLLLWFLLSFLFVVLLLQLLLQLHVMLCVCSSFFLSCTTLSCDWRAAASAAAAAARHAGCVCSSFFFVLHNADVSSTDFFFRIWAEPANITHLQCTSVYCRFELHKEMAFYKQ